MTNEKIVTALKNIRLSLTQLLEEIEPNKKFPEPKFNVGDKVRVNIKGGSPCEAEVTSWYISGDKYLYTFEYFDKNTILSDGENAELVESHQMKLRKKIMFESMERINSTLKGIDDTYDILFSTPKPIVVHIPEEWQWKPVMERIEKVMPEAEWLLYGKPSANNGWGRDKSQTCIIVLGGKHLQFHNIRYFQEKYPNIKTLTVSQFMEKYK